MIRKVKQGSAYNIPVHDYIMDSSNEVGDLPTNVPQGSTAYAINDGSQFILDSEGNWQPMLDTGRDLILLELSKKYTDDSILGHDGVIVGDSAYESAVANGYLGTEVEWLMDLQGKTPIIDEVTKTWFVYDAIEEEYKDTGIVAEGKDGKDGKDGLDGRDGLEALEVSYQIESIKIMLEIYLEFFLEGGAGELALTLLEDIEEVEYSNPLQYGKDIAVLLINLIIQNYEIFGSIDDFITEEGLDYILSTIEEADTLNKVVSEMGVVYQSLIADSASTGPLERLLDYNVGELLAYWAFFALEEGHIPSKEGPVAR